MVQSIADRFIPVIRTLNETDIDRELAQPERLLLHSATSGSRRIDIAYAPFDHINTSAKIVIVGLTPGRQQARNALITARRALLDGKAVGETLKEAKVFASFSGPMRTNLTQMLDFIGIQKLLGLETTASLWTTNNHLVHFTSALRYPVFIDGDNYSANPAILRTPILRQSFLDHFGAEASQLRNAIFVPLGPKVGEVLATLRDDVGIPDSHILSGLPHPSGANAERIHFFIDRKKKEALSGKVNPTALLAHRSALMGKIQSFAAR